MEYSSFLLDVTTWKENKYEEDKLHFYCPCQMVYIIYIINHIYMIEYI